MTLENMRARVQEIKRLAQADRRRAHELESRLWRDTLMEIIEGPMLSPRSMAMEALQTLHLKFPRYFG